LTKVIDDTQASPTPPPGNGRRVGVLSGDAGKDVTGVNSDYTPPPLDDNTPEIVEDVATDSADPINTEPAEVESTETGTDQPQGISTLGAEELEAAMQAASEGAMAELGRSVPEPESGDAQDDSEEFDDGRDLLGGTGDSWSFDEAVDADSGEDSTDGHTGDVSQELSNANRRIQELEQEGLQLRAAIEHMNQAHSKQNEDLNAATEKLVQSLQDRLTYRQRVERERQELTQYGNERLVTDLLPSLDSFERALEHTDPDSSDPFVSGIRMVRQQMMQALQRFNVEAFRSIGEAFDPTRHEAYSEVESDVYAPGTVVSVVKTGYLLSGRLLRPALVAVARAPKNVDATNSADGDEIEPLDVEAEPAPETDEQESAAVSDSESADIQADENAVALETADEAASADEDSE